MNIHIDTFLQSKKYVKCDKCGKEKTVIYKKNYGGILNFLFNKEYYCKLEKIFDSNPSFEKSIVGDLTGGEICNECFEKLLNCGEVYITEFAK